MRLVKVTWIDSYGVGASWQPLSEASDVEHTCISVGYLAKDGRNVKVVVPHYSPVNKEIDAEEQGCGDMAIPCGSIIEMIDLIPAPKEYVEEA